MDVGTIDDDCECSSMHRTIGVERLVVVTIVSGCDDDRSGNTGVILLLVLAFARIGSFAVSNGRDVR